MSEDTQPQAGPDAPAVANAAPERADDDAIEPATVGDQVRRDAARLRRAASLLSHGTIAGVVAMHIGATAALTAIVFARPFPYPFMYPLMGVLLLSLLGIRVVAVATARRGAAIRAMVTNLVMHAFFVYVLIDQIPGRTVVRRQLVERPDEWVLLLPIALYVAAMAGMVVHGILHRRSRRIAEAEAEA